MTIPDPQREEDNRRMLERAKLRVSAGLDQLGLTAEASAWVADQAEQVMKAPPDLLGCYAAAVAEGLRYHGLGDSACMAALLVHVIAMEQVCQEKERGGQ